MKLHAKRAVALALVTVLYWLARQPELTEAQRAEVAARFRFTRLALPEITGQSQRSVRTVHPNLERISAWISSVGASVALSDLDADGLPNDVCYVDTRTDQVIVAPVPGTPARYQPFALDPAPLAYDPSRMAPMGCLPGDLNEDGLMDILVYYWGRTSIAFLRRPPLTPPSQGGEEAGEHPSEAEKGVRYGVRYLLCEARSGPFRQKVPDPFFRRGNAKATEALLNANSYTPCEVVPDCGRWYTNAATLADLDGDGHADLIIGNYFPDDARVLDAEATGVEQMQHSMSRAFNGGRNRLLLWSGATSGASPTVKFKEADGVLDEEVAHGWTLAVGAADLDGDLLPEIYFANDFGPDRLLLNRSKPGRLQFARLNGVKRFTTPNSKVLGRDSFKGMGVDFGDLNGDGLLDIYVSNIAAEYALEESHFVWISTGQLSLMASGIAPYVDRSEALGLSRSGWAWEARLGDFDNDGVLEALQATGFVRGRVNRWPELHELAMGSDSLVCDPKYWPRFRPGDDLSGQQHNPFFVRAKSGRYFDLARELGLDAPMVSRGIATADVDGDGKLDFAVANQWEPSYFYHNEAPDPGAFLGLHLLLPLQPEEMPQTSARLGHPAVDMAGRPAIGAAATVHLPDGRSLVAQVDGGNGHSGKRSPDLHFGLGRLSPDARLDVDLRWRDPFGRVHRETLQLSPGWHTVLLGCVDREG